MMFRIIKGWSEEGEIEWGFNWGIFLSPFRLILSVLRWMMQKIRYVSLWIFYKAATYAKRFVNAAQAAFDVASVILVTFLMIRCTFYIIGVVGF